MTESHAPRPRHLYVHVPFCSGKCSYCALVSRGFDAPAAARLLDALERELAGHAAAGGRCRPETVYIGGGTPTILPPSLFARLLALVGAHIEPDALTEWTVEAQPGTLRENMIEAMCAAGVNRVSLGAQSFDDDTLQRVGRRHRVADTVRTIDMLRAAGFKNVGIDLIACLPGVSDAEWEATLRRAAELPVVHTSVYALTVEAGSRLGRQYRRGSFAPRPDDAVLAALDRAERVLAGAGRYRYETSNYAVPGAECRHNLACWRGEDYAGFGPSAASRGGRERWTNVADTDAYCRRLASGKPASRSRQDLSLVDDATERLIFAFRLAEGVALGARAEAPAALRAHWESTLQDLAKRGMVTHTAGRWQLTAKGRPLADTVAEALIPPDAEATR